MKRDYTYEFQIDGLPMLAPDRGVNITENDLDSSDSGRDEGGFMHRSVLRFGIKTFEFIYAILDAEDYMYIQSLFKGKADFTFQYRWVDGKIYTTTAYCSKRGIVLRDYATGEYKNLKFNIIEC